MKKTLRLIALALVLGMSVAMLASCGAPNKDPDDAVAALKDNGYTAGKDNVAIPTALRILGVDGVKAADVKDIQLVRKDTSSPAGDAITPRTLTGDIRLTLEDGETYGISI